ncbi:hypothetical protein ACVGVM_11870 [Pseudonocardia bannensis]|uniref:Uncharacterized protein n=1 Tax=Pseudonocardia bannensis TaxID=630973 RepID=A0A848DEY5_9PSEU|nr:hypothetical protein [Pseudonocardia bannensis]NMH91167.1 hypothetical protein [Pseudonocardia bannensis]
MTVPSQHLSRPAHDGPRPGDPRPADARPLEVVQAAVDAAMAGLADLAGRPAGEHVQAFERVHAALGEALAAGTPGDQAAGRA